MLIKLALRNVKRSYQDYLIYFITVTLAFSLLLAFNLLAFSKEIIELSKVMEDFKYAIIFVSIIVILVVGWLINYTTTFIFRSRSKELGTYLLLGITKKKIKQMFMLENIILGLAAYFCSFFLGIIISNLIMAIIMNIFEVPYQIKMVIALKPYLLTSIYFILIYLVVLFRSNQGIKKMKIYDLIYYEKQNEKNIYLHSHYRNLSFMVVIIIGVTGLAGFYYFFNHLNSLKMVLGLFGSIIFIIISIYGLAFTFYDFILHFVLKHPKIKYVNDNLFIVRNLASKIRTKAMILGTLSMLTMLTLVLLNIALVMKDSFMHQVETVCPYDFVIDNFYSEVGVNHYGKIDLRKQTIAYVNYVDDNFTVKDKLSYEIYTVQKNDIAKYINDEMHQQIDLYLRLSDYNKLLEMLGKEKISLNQDEYYLHGDVYFEDELKKIKEKQPELEFDNQVLKLKDVTSIDYRNSWSDCNNSYIVIIPDQRAINLPVCSSLTVINTTENTTSNTYETMLNEVGGGVVDSKNEITYEASIHVKGDLLLENRSLTTILLFSLIYLAFVFIAVVGTVLSIQTLSAAIKERQNYLILKKLGVDEPAVNKTILKQLIFNFGITIIYPIIIVIVTSLSLQSTIGALASSKYTGIFNLLMSLLIFFSIDIIYFIAAYYGFKKKIKL